MTNRFIRAFVLVLLVPLGAGCGNPTSTDVCRAGLGPGDLVITEILANPPGADEGKEWFEVYNATDRAIELTGVRVISSKADGTSEKIHVIAGATIAPRAYLVLGGMLEVARPVYVDYAYGAELGGFGNNGGALTMKCGDKLVDKIVYSDVADGKTRGFDGAQAPDAIANDDLARWCDAAAEFEMGAFGTPGAPNEPCGGMGSGTCKDALTGMVRPIVSPTVGQLVINEIMANPAGTGGEKAEWLEIAATAAVDLNGLQFATSVDPAQLKPLADLAKLDCLTVAADGYILLLRSKDETQNGGIKAGPGAFLFTTTLTDSGLTLSIGAKGAILDTVVYTAAADGASTALDPARKDVIKNDDAKNFCKGITTYGVGGLGTPGTKNESCGMAGTCKDAMTGMMRPILAPKVGQLVINEIMADPAALADQTQGEWFEVAATARVDLNGLQMASSADPAKLVPLADLAKIDCLTVEADGYAVFVHGKDEVQNGGIKPAANVFGFTAALVNGGGTLSVGAMGAILDTVIYPAATDGASTALDPDRKDAAKNDDAKNWCKGSMTYGTGGKGTPGAKNASCGIVDPGQCLDNGVARAKVAPAVGDLLLNEVMPDPSKVADGAGEWFEIRVTKDVDLNGVAIGADPNSPQTLPEGACLRATAGSFLLFAHSVSMVDNGGLPAVPPSQVFGFALGNANGALYVRLGNLMLDMTTWAAAKPAQAISRDPKDPMKWCNISDVKYQFNGTDFGTPAAVNPACP